MNKIKKIICILLTLCFIFAFASCEEKTPQSEQQSTTNNAADEEIYFVSLNKEYNFDYEWYGDTSTLLLRSEYTDVTLDKSMEENYPLLAKTLSEASAMRKRAMEDEKANFVALAKDEFENDSENFLTYVSKLDVQVRRADCNAVSILEDYGKEASRSFNGLNYDTESGKLLALSDVVTDISKISASVEKEVKIRIGLDGSDAKTAIPDYFINTPEDSITWVLDYNGITFYFEPGAIAPTNFGIQVVALEFNQYPGLFNKKYTAMPDSYVAELPVSSSYFADITGDNKSEELIIEGFLDDARAYHTVSVNSESSDFSTKMFSFIAPYFVRAADGKSYICIYNLTNEEEALYSILNVYALENGEVKFLGVSETGFINKGNNVYSLLTNPDSIIKTVKE